MSALQLNERPQATRADWVELMQTVGPRFAARAATYDADNTFVAENYAELKAPGAFAAFIPAELGGGGASYGDIADMLRTLARLIAS
jgi:indole-3-acetate monooxygenase